MGRYISDTRTMRWKIYYVHPQSDRTGQAAARRPAAAATCNAENLRTYIHTYITENNGCLAAPANNNNII